MALVQVFEEAVARRYYVNHRISVAWVFNLILLVVLIVVPYAIAYVSNQFWMKSASFSEQPRVAFKHDLVILLLGSDNTQYAWSSIDNYNSNLGKTAMRMPLIKTNVVDYQSDGVADEILVKIKTPLSANGVNNVNGISTVQIILFFQYQLVQKIRLDMESLIYFQSSIGGSNGGSKLSVLGDIRLDQKKDLPPNGVVQYLNSPIVDSSSLNSLQDVTLETILSANRIRNETMYLYNPNVIWRNGGSDYFEIDFTFYINKQEIYYRPGAWETIKFAWIQYLSIFIPLYVIIQLIRWFVFSQQILETNVQIDGKLNLNNLKGDKQF